MVPSGDPIDVVIIDKSRLVLEGIRALFDADVRFGTVTGTARADEFPELLERGAFDVAVVGWILDSGSGRDVLEWIATHDHGPRVVIYTGDPDPGIPHTVMSLGGAGFYSKSAAPERLVEIVAGVADGLMVFPFADVRPGRDDPIAALTNQEAAFIAALAEGHSNKALAARFDVSVNTVKFHLGNAYAKLGVRNRARAVAVFLQSEGGR